MKMKRMITAAACLMAAAAAAGLTSCTEMDLEQFYLESLPDSSAADTSSEAAEDTVTEEQTAEETEAAETEETTPDALPAEGETETAPADVQPAEETLPDTIYELSESELMEGGVSAETLGDSDDDSMASDEQQDGGVSAAYAAVLTEYAGKCEKDPLLKPDFCRYYIADVDGDSSPELLAETGSCEADRTVYVYTFDSASEKAKQLGSFVAWHAELGMSGGKLGCETKAMGSYLLTVVDISGGSVSTERVGVPAEKSVLDEVLPCYPFTDLSGIVGI